MVGLEFCWALSETNNYCVNSRPHNAHHDAAECKTNNEGDEKCYRSSTELITEITHEILISHSG